MKGNAVYQMSRLLERTNQFIIKELENKGINDIVPSHGDILYQLFQDEPLTMQEISKRIHRTKSTVTILVKKLEDKGYIERQKNEEDSRSTLISLTEKGRALHPIFEEISENLQERLYGGYSRGQVIMFEELLEIAYDRFNPENIEEEIES
ncbi:MarR family winged helix-turn-helix transcriptional regulator [Methanospirillum sp.]|uniref:MarR family winged helix-turn-helix transcriptional regulator n=1 Tax=Methanospirillum sp. TaxID=45200 RepID=UPI0035A10BC9